MSRWRTLALVELAAILVVAILLWQRRTGEDRAQPPAASGAATPASKHEPPPTTVTVADSGPATPPPTPTTPPDDVIAADDPIGLVLHGSVRSVGGVRPVTRASAVLSREGSPAIRAWLPEPSFAFVGVAPGRWLLRIEAEGFEPYEADVDVAPGPRVQRHDADLVVSMIVKVALLTADGTPLLQAEGMAAKLRPGTIEVVATASEPPELLPAALPPSHGVSPTRATWRPSGGPLNRGASLPKRYAGELTLRLPPPLWVSAYLGARRLATTPLPTMQEEVVLTVDAASFAAGSSGVTFRVVAVEDRAPLPGAIAQLGNMFNIRSDANGIVRVGDVAPGRYEWTVRVAGRAHHGGVLELTPGQTADLGEIALPPPLEGWPGTVVDQAGKPIAARVRLREIDSADPWLGMVSGPQAVADAAGAFTLEGLAPKRYVLLAGDDRAAQMAIAVLDASGARAELTLRLQPTATLNLSTRLAGVESMRVLLRDGAGHPISWQILFAAQTVPLRLLPGSYTLEVSTARGNARRVPVTLTAAGGELVLE